jgi:Cu/Ag efflux protein CusF
MKEEPMPKSVVFAACVLMVSFVAVAAPRAQEPKTVTKQNKMTAAVTIKAIDRATRSVTLHAENGDEDTFTVGPEVKRFDQLKVGDTIKATYYESLVLQLRKPGAAAPTTGAVAAGGRMKDVPGGAIGVEQTTSVTVKAIDMNAPSITVTTADGRTLTRKIADKKNLEGVTPGDHIDITYTQGLLVAAETAKK